MKVKKVLALALALALAMTLLPTVALGAELTKLPTPTDLEWGKHYDQNIPGCSSWSMTSHAGKAEVRYYSVVNDQTPAAQTDWDLFEGELEMCDPEFVCRSNELASGSYYFTVQLKGDGKTYADSEIARSDPWTYTKPSAKLPTPAAPAFLPQGTTPEGWEVTDAVVFVRWDGTEDRGYQAEFYFSDSNSNATSVTSLTPLGSMSDFYNEGIAWLSLHETQGTGKGYYYIRIRSLSKDINKTQNSDWSPLSAAFYYDAGGETPSSPKPSESTKPSTTPSAQPSATPSTAPSAAPSVTPSNKPSASPSVTPSITPSTQPSSIPSTKPSTTPSAKPSTAPSTKPSESPKPSAAPVAVTGVSVAKTASVQGGKSKTLTATVKPSNADNKRVYWTSDDTYVVSVDTNGKITGVKTGTANVTVTTVDGGFTATCAVTVYTSSIGGGGGGGSSSGGGGASGGGGGGGAAKPSVTPSAQPSQKPIDISKPASENFSDVVKGSWYEDGVTYVVQKGLFNGVAQGQFAPQQNMTRAMLVTVLARLDGQDTTGGPTWYSKGTDWAKAQGVSDGTMLDSSVTREQMVTMLYRYAKAQAGTADLSAFTDGATVSDWAKDAMAWAVANGILTGKDGSRLDPQGTATRAEVATILQRFVEKK